VSKTSDQQRIDALLATIARLEASASNGKPRAAEAVKPAVNPYKANRLARRALAASMRKAGIEITTASWAKAKRQAGIKPVKA
jgi:hypothetical protein